MGDIEFDVCLSACSGGTHLLWDCWTDSVKCCTGMEVCPIPICLSAFCWQCPRGPAGGAENVPWVRIVSVSHWPTCLEIAGRAVYRLGHRGRTSFSSITNDDNLQWTVSDDPCAAVSGNDAGTEAELWSMITNAGWRSRIWTVRSGLLGLLAALRSRLHGVVLCRPCDRCPCDRCVERCRWRRPSVSDRLRRRKQSCVPPRWHRPAGSAFVIIVSDRIIWSWYTGH